MNFDVDQNTPKKFRTDVVLADKDSGEVYSNKIRFIYLVMPLFKKKDVFVNKEYVGPFNHRTAPQQYGGNKRQGYKTGDSCQEISVE